MGFHCGRASSSVLDKRPLTVARNRETHCRPRLAIAIYLRKGSAHAPVFCGDRTSPACLGCVCREWAVRPNDAWRSGQREAQTVFTPDTPMIMLRAEILDMPTEQN